MRLKTKLTLALILMWLGLFLLGAWAAFHARSVVTDERQAAVNHVVDLGYSLVESYAAEVAAGRLELPAAKEQALARLSKLRFDNGKNFLFVIDSAPLMLMHPTGGSLIGTNVGDRKDPDGVAYYRELAAMGQKNGQGFVSYQAGVTKPDGTVERMPKITYVRYNKAWTGSRRACPPGPRALAAARRPGCPGSPGRPPAARRLRRWPWRP
eukprot:gene24725-31100_t